MHQNINKLLAFKYEYGDYLNVALSLLGKVLKCLNEHSSSKIVSKERQ